MRQAGGKSASISLELVGRYIGGLMARGAELVGKFALYVLAARFLGANDAGMFFLCLTWIGVLATVGRLGLDRALTRHLAARLAVGELDAARHELKQSLIWSFGLALVASLLVWLIAPAVAVHIFKLPELVRPLELTSAMLLPMSATIMLGAALTGVKRTVTAQAIQNSIWPILAAGALLAGARDLQSILLAVILALTFSAGLGAVLFFGRPIVAAPSPSAISEPLGGLWRTSLPLCVVEVAQVGLSALPVLVLGAVAPPAEVGAFSIANRISQLIWVAIVSVGTLAAPTFAELHRLGAVDRLRRNNEIIRLGVMAVGLPAILIMLVFPVQLLHLIGPGFDSAATALRILALGQLINCMLPCQDVLLAMTGHGVILRRLNLLQVGVGLALCAALEPWLGMLGAAIVAAWVLIQGAVGTTLAAQWAMPQAGLRPRLWWGAPRPEAAA